MKIIFSFCLVLSVLFFFVSCSQEASSNTEVTPPSKDVKTLTPEREEPVQFPPRIPIPADKKVLEIQNLNLDETGAEEQILFLQTLSDLSLPIEVTVVAFNPTLKNSYVAWAGATLARANQPFNFSLVDLVGDHKNELVVRGLDDKGRPCIDIFRRVPAPGGVGLQYKSALSLATQGTVDIVIPPPSGDEKTVASSMVITEESDTASANIMDTVRSVYTWKYQTGKFEKTKTERYKKETKNDSVMEKLFLGDNAQIEKFLSGAWLKSDADPKEGRPILFFDPKAREIVLYNEKSQEVYSWDVSSRTVRNGLYLVGSNSLINLIKLQMSLTITSSKTLDVTTQENSSWTGTFQRLETSAFNSLTTLRSSSLEQIKGPTGLYRDDRGDEFQFDIPNLTISEKGKKQRAAASLFQLNHMNILQVRVIDDKGVLSPTRNYLITLKEEKSSNRIIRTVTLQSGTVTTAGWKSDLTELIKLEQVEALGDNTNY